MRVIPAAEALAFYKYYNFMAKLGYLLRGARDAILKKTVVVRFRHNLRPFDRTTEAKVKKKNFNLKAGLIKSRVKGSAGENKEIDLVRSRFYETLRRIKAYQLAPPIGSFRFWYEDVLSQAEGIDRNGSK